MPKNDESFFLADISERFAVMRKLDSTTYRCGDYLSSSFEATHLTVERNSKVWNTILEEIKYEADGNEVNSYLNESWREKICEWTYQVVDHFDLSRETAGISISFLDRYLCTQKKMNKKLFQLAAMTTLHIASKLNEPDYKVVPMSSLTELSRGFFTIDHIRSMEKLVLNALEWHMHPPTTLAFLRQILLLFENSFSYRVSSEVTGNTTQTAQFLTELSVCDYFFVPRKACDVALACVLTAMDTMADTHVPSSARNDFIRSVMFVTGIDCTSIEVSECQDRLKEMYQQSDYYRPVLIEDEIPDRKRQKNSSPVCVSDYARDG